MGSETAVSEETVHQCNYDKAQFQSKKDVFTPKLGACVDTRFWHVSRRRVAKEKRFCIVRSEDLER